MSSSLRALGNASAGRKEENMFKVFAYLNTRQEFNAMLLTQRTGVTAKTVESYLKQIQEAQMLDVLYQSMVKRPFEDQWYASMSGMQGAFAKLQHTEWQKRMERVLTRSEEKNQFLLQFIFEDTTYKTKEELYQRLEQALLMYSYMNAPKKVKEQVAEMSK